MGPPDTSSTSWRDSLPSTSGGTGEPDLVSNSAIVWSPGLLNRSTNRCTTPELVASQVLMDLRHPCIPPVSSPSPVVSATSTDRVDSWLTELCETTCNSISSSACVMRQRSATSSDSGADCLGVNIVTSADTASASNAAAPCPVDDRTTRDTSTISFNISRTNAG